MDRLEQLCDLATQAHEQVQAKHADIDPVVGVNQKMRDAGFATDVMTIDHLKDGKRIIVILNDNQPEVVQYQFSFREQDPSDNFEEIAFEQLTVTVLYDWMVNYFATPRN